MDYQKCAAVLALLGCFWGSAASFADRNAPPPRTLRHSDVVFMYDDPKQYEPYGCTVLGWAGWAGAKHIEEAHAKGVRLFATSVGFLTESSRVIDFSPDFLDAACRNFEGQPFVVPWLWDQKHKGQPAWWWCTNSPLYRKYLKMRLAEVMKAQPDGLHIDDYRGTSGAVTWLSACFCRHCMAGFREYLGKAVPKEKLAALGIKDLDGFDYRQFLLDRGVKPEDYQKRRKPPACRRVPRFPGEGEHRLRRRLPPPGRRAGRPPAVAVRQLGFGRRPIARHRPAPELLLLRGGPRGRKPGAAHAPGVRLQAGRWP